jgi:hypothetical protein
LGLPSSGGSKGYVYRPSLYLLSNNAFDRKLKRLQNLGELKGDLEKAVINGSNFRFNLHPIF